MFLDRLTDAEAGLAEAPRSDQDQDDDEDWEGRGDWSSGLEEVRLVPTEARESFGSSDNPILR